MDIVFYMASAIAIFATVMVITRSNPVHALLYMVLSLLSVALIFFVLGAPFVAALEAIVYAGAIVVLFVFVVMMLDLKREVEEAQRDWARPRAWIIPAALAAILLAQLVYVLVVQPGEPGVMTAQGPREVGLTLFGPYLLAVELSSILLLAGLLGAYHLGRSRP
ncbi:MAG TPA: NADH-quinone oxidoreductase subunit J [Candidatus Sulfomarinibacteraceae bacterium]|nr:NADH-quinone oxidoreductase subunit J [Candidatus Sulfomarinibacteraceae bacterium]